MLENWQESLAPPSFSTFYRYVQEASTKGEIALKKKGKKFHKSNFTPSLASFQGAIMPMQVLQIDNTSLDVFPVDMEYHEPLATPNLTAAIDCFTGMITGIYLSYEDWSSQTVLETLVQSILPKKYFEQTFGTEAEWRIDGFPVLIQVDNGMDYRAKEILKFCLDYDIILEYAPLRNPKYKARIERWFAVLKNALKREIKDGFRPSLYERRQNPDLKPEASAVHTLQTIEKWLYMWIVDEYHLRNQYDDHIPAPILRLEDAYFGRTEVFLPSPREYPKDGLERDIMLISTLNDLGERKIDKEGVKWEYLRYNNEKLYKIYEKYGKIKIKTLQDRRDIRNIWIIFEGKPIQVELGSGWASAVAKTHGYHPINASAWVRDVRGLPKEIRRRITPYTYLRLRSKQRRNELLEKSKRDTKKLRRIKERARDSEKRLVRRRLQTMNEREEEPIPDTKSSIFDEIDKMIDDIKLEELTVIKSDKGVKRSW